MGKTDWQSIIFCIENIDWLIDMINGDGKAVIDDGWWCGGNKQRGNPNNWCRWGFPLAQTQLVTEELINRV